jgi:CRP-like cAMP-binding protein
MKEFENTTVPTGSVERPVAMVNTADIKVTDLPFSSAGEIRSGGVFDQHIPFNGLLTNKLLAALPGPDFARLLPHMEPVSLSASQNLYSFGDRVSFAYFPETVVVTHLYFLADGSTTAAALIGNEGMIGLSAIFASAPQSYATQITIAGSALRVDIDTLRQEFSRGEALQKALLSYTSVRLAQLSQKAVCNSRHRLDEKLCTWLLMVHDRAGQNRLRLTHEQIAHHLGARRAGITDACNALRSKGVINYRRGAIRISNRDLLEEAACECYATLTHLQRHVNVINLLKSREPSRTISAAG